jgi:carbamoyltransferase
MARVLGINAVFHDPAAVLLVDGEIVAAAEEERFSRRKHGKSPVAFSTWELPEQAIRWCASFVDGIDAVAYSYSPALCAPVGADITAADWEGLRTLYAQRAPLFLRTVLDGWEGDFRWVPHHVAHAASATFASGFDPCSVLVLDGRGERASSLAGRFAGGALDVLATQALPHSLGLLYEDLTEHLGFRRSSDEYKVMALASYGRPALLDELRRLVVADGRGGYRVGDVSFAGKDADVACSVQRRLEEVLLELCSWLFAQTGDRDLVLAGGVALNCVANSRIWRESPFERVWVQPAAGDSGTALGAAMQVAFELGDRVAPMRTAALGREWDEEALGRSLATAGVEFTRPDDVAEAVASVLADDGVVAWFQGRSEFGPRALGHRSLLADPRRVENLERLNDIKGREQFRPVAPMVLESRAASIFSEGPLPSPYMLFTHRVAQEWLDRIPAVVHVDGTARVQTVDAHSEPLVARMLSSFEALTGVPVVVNTSLNTAGRPMVDDVRDALECFGSSPVDALAIGPFLLTRAGVAVA